MKKTYLGDSVYAEFDGEFIWLTTENGSPGDPSNRIGIDQSVYNCLLIYAARVWNMSRSGKVES